MAISPSVRFQVLSRDQFRCQYCGKEAPDVELEIDHIHAHANGGDDAPENLFTACRECNRGKGTAYVPITERRWRHLEGKFFHRIGAEGRAKWQGRVLAALGDGYYMVELFQWITGHRAFDGRRVIHINEMATRDGQDWAFYLDDEEMGEAYNYGGLGGMPPPRDGPEKKKP